MYKVFMGIFPSKKGERHKGLSPKGIVFKKGYGSFITGLTCHLFLQKLPGV